MPTDNITETFATDFDRSHNSGKFGGEEDENNVRKIKTRKYSQAQDNRNILTESINSEIETKPNPNMPKF